MLYFLYNSEMVAVLVCHDIQKGEFVLQVPYFPPVESVDDYKDVDKCKQIVRKSIFSTESPQIDIEIKSVNTWRMEAVVADSYINKGSSPYAFLVGDAAHAFPPSGGFGMNTGIGDSFNLAHKLAAKGSNLKDYDRERRYVGCMTRDLALINYEKSVAIARMLGLDK